MGVPAIVHRLGLLLGILVVLLLTYDLTLTTISIQGFEGILKRIAVNFWTGFGKFYAVISSK